MRDVQLVRSWPELLPSGILLEEFALPPHFAMGPQTHDTAHGWLILGGGFEQDTQDGLQWHFPGELAAYPGGALHSIHTGDRGGRCLVFEAVTAVDAHPIANALHLAMQDAERAREVLDRLLARDSLRREPIWLAEVDALIAARFRRSLRAGDIARRIGLNRAHLVREYRRFRGRTIADQVRMLRLGWARELLMQRALPLHELAAEAGFADQSHFTREFSMRYGMSPRRYRNAPFVQERSAHQSLSLGT